MGAGARSAEESKAATCGSDGRIMRKDSSVSMWADRELRLVEPKRVRIGGADGVGDSHIPVGLKLAAVEGGKVDIPFA